MIQTANKKRIQLQPDMDGFKSKKKDQIILNVPYLFHFFKEEKEHVVLQL